MRWLVLSHMPLRWHCRYHPDRPLSHVLRVQTVVSQTGCERGLPSMERFPRLAWVAAWWPPEDLDHVALLLAAKSIWSESLFFGILGTSWSEVQKHLSDLGEHDQTILRDGWNRRHCTPLNNRNILHSSEAQLRDKFRVAQRNVLSGGSTFHKALRGSTVLESTLVDGFDRLRAKRSALAQGTISRKNGS